MKLTDRSLKLYKKGFKEFLATEIIEWFEAHTNKVQARPYLRQQLMGLHIF